MNKYVVMSLDWRFYYSLLKDKAWVRNERRISFLPEARAQRQRNENQRRREKVPVCPRGFSSVPRASTVGIGD
jgi:hypothetical protein